MNLDAAQRLARSLMAEHGLSDWTFRFDGAKKRFGCCFWKTRRITVSRHLTSLNDEVHVRDVILHEIAHALVDPGEHHGPKWKAAARRIGASDSRCYSDEVDRPEPHWLGTCPGCRRVIKRFRRKKIACSHCCRNHGDGRFDLRFVFEWAPNPDAAGLTRVLGDA